MVTIEEIQRKEQETTAKRKAGIEKLKTYLEKAIKSEDLANPDFFVERLAHISYEQFTKILNQVNERINDALFPTQGTFKKVSGVTATQFASEASELVPPPLERRNELMREMFGKMQLLAQSDDPNKAQIIARTLYNTIIYLHPFWDGNGRVARLAYFLISPHAAKNDGTIFSDIVTLLEARPKELREYHDWVNYGIFQSFQEGAGIEIGKYHPRYRDDNPVQAFDSSQLRFLAAYRAMTPEERSKYIESDDESLSIRADKLPEQLKKKTQEELVKLRDEFTRFVLDWSMNTKTDAWHPDHEKLLDEAIRPKNTT